MTLLNEPLTAIESFTTDYRDLFKDARLYKGFQATITGILASGTTRIRQIARAAPQTGVVAHSERRIRRLVHNQNQRADISVEAITSKITTGGAKRLAREAEVKVILDGSDLRKPYSTSLEFLSTVRALNGDLIPGYPTLNAIGIGGNGVQALLYHKTFSPLEPEFKSEREEVRRAIEAITTALRAVGVGRITWILDRGFDDAKVIRWILATGSRFVIRAAHNRNVRASINGRTKKLFESLRWAIEEVFSWTKTALEWEAARVLEFTAFKRLVAFAWVAAAFVFDLGVSVEHRVVQHLVLLGGWVPRLGERPGRRVLCLGLARVLNALLVEGFSSRMQVGMRVLDEVNHWT